MTIVTPDRMIVDESRADDPCGPSRAFWISEAGGLTQFGAFVHELPPGSRTALAHWHSAEDEMVYVLSGELTVVENGTATPLGAGAAATFRAGDPIAHFVENRGQDTARCLVVGTRAPADAITYPDHGRMCMRDSASPQGRWTDLAGRPARNPYL
ncbi:cupin domain-containing protein [Xanthobacter tagetidis]|uniref:Cupin domain-containing protein n=2 Tax=Xanthobacter tagetidis TaxID=60216 RepID=A0A3L7AQU8_9HYPH|nr:cupin domain-containing protein [Xanthobacter tagetidis]